MNTPTAMQPNKPRTVKATSDHLLIDGRPVFLFGGDFNYTRTPRREWRDRLLKMKAAGMNCVTFYITWGYHEPFEGKLDFSGERDVAAFLDLIHETGMYAITRHGPFVHGEWRNGGLPEWLLGKLGPGRVRTNDAEYLEITRGWYEAQMKIVVPRLATRGGPIVMVQLENELGSAGSKGDDIARGSTDAAENAKHVLHYYKIICDHGVDVPVIDISKWPGKEEAIASLVDTGGGYPAACFGCDGEVYPINRERWGKHQRPYVSIETGSCMFVRFYDLPPYRNTSSYQGPIIDPALIESLCLGHLAEGASGINLYMITDGQHGDHPAGETNGERMLPERDVNFQCPITVSGNLRESYRWMKRLGWMLRSFEQEMLGAKPNYEWAVARTYGKAHPGVEQSGDLFENYHREDLQIAKDFNHVGLIDSAGRCTRGLNLSETNFLILRNTSRRAAQWKRDVRIETSARGIPCETSREYPARTQLNLPPNQNRILPFYLRIQPRTFLEYSTAELLDRRAFGAGNQLVLHAEANETFESAIVTERPCAIRTRGECLPLWENPNTVNLIGRTGPGIQVSILELEKPVRIVHLDRERAGDAWEIASPTGQLVASCTATVLDSVCGPDASASQVRLELRRPDFSLWLLTPSEPVIEGVAGQFDSAFCVFEGLGTVADWPEKNIAWRKRREGNRLIWEADVTPALLDGTRDVVIEARYKGTCGRAYLGDHLISDHYFGRFLFWEIGLRDWLTQQGVLSLEFDECSEADVKVVPVVERDLKVQWKP